MYEPTFLPLPVLRQKAALNCTALKYPTIPSVKTTSFMMMKEKQSPRSFPIPISVRM